ncbi:MAG: FAD-dependent oxidoreductase [Deltaproteobacteria bacterium]|nr:FAD-dependent oxidoreductase [Deltaproteobacteria bacterium]
MDFYETVFIGAGLSCLAAARAWRGDAIVLEREARPGGLCRSEQAGGFTFDRTGHLLHLRHARTRRLVRRLLAGELAKLERDTWVYSHGVYTRYPFQSHFHGLPPEVAAECLLGAFEAERESEKRRAEPRRFDRWVLDRFGRGVARHFMFPYNRKLWTVPPESLTTDWLGRFVPRPDLREIVLGALADRPERGGYNARFDYPLRGGIESLVRALARGVRRLECGCEVRRIDLDKRELAIRGGGRLRFGRLVSSAPLPELVRMTRPLPDPVRKAASQLRCASVYNLNLGIRDPGKRFHWVYVPEPRYAIYRFGISSNFTLSAAPAGAAAVYTEWAYRGKRPDPAAMRRKVLADMKSIGLIRSRADVLAECPLDLEHAYAIYDRHRGPAVARIRRHLEKRGVYPIGRYGRWEYSSMEDAIMQGLELAGG